VINDGVDEDKLKMTANMLIYGQTRERRYRSIRDVSILQLF
jgi:hypothetical protein